MRWSVDAEVSSLSPESRQAAVAFEQFACDARPDFHEPDEQAIAFVELSPGVLSNSGSAEELALVMSKHGFAISFNLCDILAMARIGARVITGKTGASGLIPR